MGTASNVMAKFVAYVVDPFILLVFATAFFWFIWGIVKFLWSFDEGTKELEAGKSHMWWGLIGMLIMVSVAGFIMIINNTFDLGLSYSGGGTFNVNPDVGRINNVQSQVNFFSN
jgi:uncharacterized ion transporter superfamily protein YfcC